MAERILRGMLARMKRRDVIVHSAGMIDMHGAPGDATAVNILGAHNFDGQGHAARSYSEDMLWQADMIVVMENVQK